MTPPPTGAAFGRTIGGHRLVREIGRGASGGAVYGAIDLRTQAPRALKVVPLAAGDADARGRFDREARAAAALRHPGIVAVHAWGVEGDVGWMAMDALTGRDLTHYAAPARRLPEPLVLEVGRRLALALDHAHAQGVVHRDLKPANVIVDWPADRVTLTDFGLARIADAERTRSGLVLGSPAYMAPEVLAGQPASAASDLYALGVLMWQLLAGRLPFESSNLADLLRQAATAPPADVRTAGLIGPEDALADLAVLLSRLMAKKPAGRPSSGADLAGRLGAIASRWTVKSAG